MISQKKTLWQYWIPLLFLGVFFFMPLGAIFIKAFQAATPGWVISFPEITRPLLFTFFQASLSLLITLLVGMPAAYIFSHFRFRGSTVVQVVVMLPFVLPTVLVAAGFNALVGSNGLVNLFLVSLFKLSNPPIHFLGTFGAILTAHVFYNTTIIIRVVGGAWQELNYRYIQAGKVLGANPSQLFHEITLPLLLPAVISASLLVFLFDFSSFGVILLLGGPAFSTLETEIYNQSLNLFNLRLAGILSMIQLVCTLGMTVLINRISGSLGFHSMANRIRGPASKINGFFKKLCIHGYTILLFGFFGFPILSLGIRSLLYQTNTVQHSGIPLTLSFYQALFINRQNSIFYVPPIQAIINSLVFALATTAISILIGSFSAYALNQKSIWSRILDPLLMLPLGASAVTLGLGFVVSFGQLPQSLVIFPFLIPVIHSLVAFPFVVRILLPAISTIPASLHATAASLGASPKAIFWQIDLPLLRKPLITAALFSFAISLGEFGATLFLARPEFPTIPVAIYRFLGQPGSLNYGQAMAMATILMVLCTVCILGIEYLNRKLPETGG
jgi:thiamine transport system permease protein